jgi:PPP family 3-phenylpropionic acid transporter
VNAAPRFALLYGAQFLGFGAMMPFLPAILAEGGLDPGAIGLVLAAGSLLRVLAGPAIGRVADRAADPRRLLAACCVVAAAAGAGFGLAAGFAALLAVQLIHSAAAAPVIPLSDSQAAAAVRAGGFDYARVRAVGSATFIAGALAAGFAAEAAGPRVAAWLLAAGLLVTAMAALWLPALPRASGAARGGLLAPLARADFRRALLAASLVQGSHAAYYGFATLHWQAAGLSTGFIGVLWALGVVAEIGLFLVGGRLAERLGTQGLVLLGALGGALRWTVTALTTEPIALVLVQPLHAASFGAMHLAAMRAMVALPEGLAGRAQTLLAAAVGASTGLLIWASGPVFEMVGGLVFLAMAALCVVAASMAWRARDR